MLESYYWNGVIFFGFGLTFVGYFVTGFFYQSFTWYVISKYLFSLYRSNFIFFSRDFISVEFTYYRSFENVLRSAYTWLLILLLVLTASIPDIIIRALRDNFSVLYANTHSSKVVCIHCLASVEYN
jgi:hypothetical protein